MKRIRWSTSISVAALLCLAIASSRAFGNTYRILVKAGFHARGPSPVLVTLEESETQANLAPVILKQAKSVRLFDSRGNEWAAQLTAPGLLNKASRPGAVVRELHFIAPRLEKGATIELTATVSKDAGRAGGFAWKDTPGDHFELLFATRPVARYVYRALDESSPEARNTTSKVFHHLYDLSGSHFVTNGPGGKYPHHRGLFFGFSRISYRDVQRVNTWSCSPGAHQAHAGLLAAEAGPVLGRHAVKVHWHGREAEPFCVEQRELTFYHIPGGHFVEFASRLTSQVGKVRLDGDPQHAGFHFRAAQEVADGDPLAVYFLRADGRGAPGETRNWDHQTRRPDCVNLPWNAMSFVVGGQRYTAVYLDHPDNPKEARYSERNYGRFGSYFEYDLDDRRDLEIKYRIWLQEGEMTVEEAAALGADFTEPVQAVVDR